VQLPELPDPRMVMRSLIKSPGGPARMRASPRNNDKARSERQSRMRRTGFSLFSFEIFFLDKKSKPDRLKPVAT
jgi:hypothetical protein